LLAVVPCACGGAPAAPQVPAAPVKPVASAPPPAPADLSAVPDPQTLVVSGRAAKLSGSFGVVHGWTKLPMPQSEQVTEMLTSEAVGPLVDVDQPVDFAVAVLGTGSRMKPLVAVSAAVKDGETAKAALSDRYKLVPGANGAVIVQGLGRAAHHDDEDDAADESERRTCELAPAYGAAATRIVCGWNAKALAELGPWLTRSATRATSASDLHVDVRMQPLRATISEGKRMFSMLLGGALGAQLGTNSAREAASSIGSDLADFALDLDTLAIDVALSDPAVNATVTLKLAGTSSIIGRMATAHPERSGPAPATFWQLPADADSAVFTRGVGEADYARLREIALKLLGDALGEQGLKDPERKAVLDPLAKLPLGSWRMSAGGLDAGAVKRALGAEKSLGASADAAARADAKRAAAEALLGWRIFQLDEPSAKLGGSLKELAAAWSRPAVLAAYHARGKDAVMPSVHAGLSPKGTQLPKDTAHYVVELHPFEHDAAAPKGKGKPAPPAKPISVHLYVVPDGQRTWIGVGGDEALVTAKLASTLAGTGDTLASRPELAWLKTGPVGAAGFYTPRGLPEGAAQMALLSGGVTLNAAEGFEEAAALPHQGMTPVSFALTAQPGASPPPVVMTLQVPRGAIEDIVVAVLRHGGF
jgi:hypothetical protein